ncbi:hypothetical protein NDU88_000069 [Pleurodeles waltl]|uniref:Uncharacterized protein n=1 Tax=Pleurodeles waltl TaxID=8319 RepID=A0AAV7KLG9_PLEWA|nr:hypothetical protein NDU88_000069 [Pleurodeles waltl]
MEGGKRKSKNRGGVANRLTWRTRATRALRHARHIRICNLLGTKTDPRRIRSGLRRVRVSRAYGAELRGCAAVWRGAAREVKTALRCRDALGARSIAGTPGGKGAPYSCSPSRSRG